MPDSGKSLGSRVALVLALCTTAPCQAQIAFDGTMGTAGALSGPDFAIPHTAGRNVDSNLFHSFDVFNIQRGESATFTGPSGIDNVLSRVTGASASTIDGLLRSTVPGADFYFLNPNGVVFGPHAALDVPASFHVSTADYLRDADGRRFNALPAGGELLKIAAPDAFGFLGDQPAGIAFEGSGSVLAEVNADLLESFLGLKGLDHGIRVPDGETLSVIGGDIALTEGVFDAGFFGSFPVESRIRARGGQVRLVSAASAGEVGNWDTNVQPAFEAFGEIGLSGESAFGDRTLVTTSGGSGGQVVVRGGRFQVTGSSLQALTIADLDNSSGGIDIEVTGEVIVDEGSLIATGVRGDGSGGNIRIKAGEVEIRGAANPSSVNDLSGVTSSAFAGGGRAGSVTVESGALTLDSGGVLQSNTFAQGNAGVVSVMADEVTVLDGSNIGGQTQGGGTGAIVDVRALNVTVSDDDHVFGDICGCRASIASDTVLGGGNAGSVTVVAEDSIELLDGGVIRSASFAGGGNAGGVSVDAGRVFIGREAGDPFTGIDSSVERGSLGNGGSVSVRARDLAIRSGGVVRAVTFADGDAGAVRVESDKLLISRDEHPVPTGITSNTVAGSMGNAGSVTVDAAHLEVRNGGVIRSDTFSVGDAGTVIVNAERLLISGDGASFVTGITSSAEADFESGSGGNVVVTAGQLVIVDGGVIRSGTFNDAAAGSVRVTADDIFISAEGSSIFTGINSNTETDSSSGNGGEVFVSANRIVVRGRGEISSATASGGDAGTVRLRAGTLSLLDGGQISTSARSTGDGGTVDIRVDRDLLISGVNATGFPSGLFAVVQTTREDSGRGGTIRVVADNITLSSGGEISARSEGGGDAGAISIDGGTLTLRQSGTISTEALRSDGGNIKLSVDDRVLLEDSLISATVQGGEGAGGNVDIDPRFVILFNSRIVANAFGGPGGNISITTDNFFIDGLSLLSASSAQSIDGTVAIDAPDTDVSGTLAVLPGSFQDAGQLLRQSCAQRTAVGSSSFVMSGRGGLPPDPDDFRAANAHASGIAINDATVAERVASTFHCDQHSG